VARLGRNARIALLIGLVVAILFLVGLVGGAIGQAMGVDIGVLKVPELQIHEFFKGDVLFSAGPLNISNTLLASWITIIVVVVFCFAATRKMRVIPRRLQGLIEVLMEMLLNFIESVAGRKHGRAFLPVVATIFIFVIFNAYLALLPFYGSGIVAILSEEVTAHADATIVSMVENDSKVEKGQVIMTLDDGTEIQAEMSGHIEFHEGVEVGSSLSGVEEVAEIVSKPPLLRSASTDINMTLALAVMAVLFVEFSGVRFKGFRHWISEYVNFGELVRGFKLLAKGKFADSLMSIITGVINAVMGLLEAISHGTRMISFAFRLFGNMTAGEILLMSATFLIPWVMAIPFYGLELLIGFIQALIFGGLTLVFASIAVAHGSEEH
jgi:F0F1-type ATP synthase membrane subunit a